MGVATTFLGKICYKKKVTKKRVTNMTIHCCLLAGSASTSKFDVRTRKCCYNKPKILNLPRQSIIPVRQWFLVRGCSLTRCIAVNTSGLSTYSTLYYTVLYCTVLYCTVLYCTVLYYTILYYTILY